jgi:hypothetical protein
MSENLAFLFLGVLLSVPIGFAVNLYTDRVGGFFAKRSAHSRRRRLEALRRDYEYISGLRRDTRLYYTLLLEAVLRATLVGSLAAVVAGALFVTSSLSPGFGVLDNLIQALGQIISVAGALLIIGICGNALRTSTKVRNYHAWSEEISRQVERAEPDVAEVPSS